MGPTLHAPTDKPVPKETVTKLRDAREGAGRDRYSAKAFTLLTIITDGSEWTVGDIASAGAIGGLGANYRVGVTAV